MPHEMFSRVFSRERLEIRAFRIGLGSVRISQCNDMLSLGVHIWCSEEIIARESGPVTSFRGLVTFKCPPEKGTICNGFGLKEKFTAIFFFFFYFFYSPSCLSK